MVPKKDKSIREYRNFIQSLPTDNPNLPESYLASLLQLDKNSRERLYFGNWEYDDDPSALISQDAMVNYFNTEHLQRGKDRFITIDVARHGKDKSVFRVWYGWVCVYSFRIEKSGLDIVVSKAKELMRTHNIPISNVVADEDGVGGGVVDFLKCKGFVNNSKALNGENYSNLKKLGNCNRKSEFVESCTKTCFCLFILRTFRLLIVLLRLQCALYLLSSCFGIRCFLSLLSCPF
jgi:hypothetical protein